LNSVLAGRSKCGIGNSLATACPIANQKLKGKHQEGNKL
jgi:hypothetical protein